MSRTIRINQYEMRNKNKRHKHMLTLRQIYIDSRDATRSLSANDVRKQVRQLVSGFKNHDLVKGDCVCVISFNDVR
jgi:long-subunit acyl-CoA synthetase (AMP-forming)